MEFKKHINYKSKRLSDHEYASQLEYELLETNKRIDEFKKLMNKAVHTIKASEVLDTYLKYVSYLDGRKTFEECKNTEL